MSLLIGLLTIVLVINSLFLILLVLMQLPKKEAGLGMAFGGAAADALFGAGSGTMLSKWTKYGTGLFLGLSLVLSVMRNHEHRSSGRTIREQLNQPAAAATVTPPLATTNPAVPSLQLPPALSTNPPAAATATSPTNPPAPAPAP